MCKQSKYQPSSRLVDTACTPTRHTSSASWGYEPHNGPDLWGTLDPTFSLCNMGKEQSPINLTNSRKTDLTPVEFYYRQTRITIKNTGHTIQVNVDNGSSIVIDGMHYDLQQFHFHHGSEHTIDGKQLPLEMHLVHSSESGSLAVVGVLFTEGKANNAMVPVWSHLPLKPATSHPVPGKLNLESLLPACRTMWRYRGSLTTPPCTEDVTWAILTETISMSITQIEAFSAVYPRNCRPVQPLGKRVLCCG